MNVLRLLMVSTLLLLAGCGFHLRGNIDLPADLQRMYVDGTSKYSGLGLELRRSLRANGVELVDKPGASQVTLKISAANYKRRLLSVSGTSGKTAEYELKYSLSISLQDRDGKVLLAPQTLRQRRDYTYDRDNVLGKGNEEARFRVEMERDLVRQILRRLQSYRRG